MNFVTKPINRPTYFISYTLLLLVAYGLAAIIRNNRDELWWLGWVFGLVSLPLVIILSIKRLRDIGAPSWLSILSLVPVVTFFLFIALCVWPGKKK